MCTLLVTSSVVAQEKVQFNVVKDTVECSQCHKTFENAVFICSECAKQHSANQASACSTTTTVRQTNTYQDSGRVFGGRVFGGRLRGRLFGGRLFGGGC